MRSGFSVAFLDAPFGWSNLFLLPCLFGCRLKLRLIADRKIGVVQIAQAHEIGVVSGVRTKGRTAGLKTEFLKKSGSAQNEQCLLLDRCLAQGKAQQFCAHSLFLKFGAHGYHRQVQAADLAALIGISKGDVGDGLAGVEADPFVEGFVSGVEQLHQGRFILALGERVA